MVGIGNLNEAFQWSISKISEAFSLDRATVRKRLVEAGIEPAGKVRGNPVYHLRDAGPALFQTEEEVNPESIHNPSTMHPKDRKDWYQSENERIKLEKEQRKLIPADEVVIVYSAMRKAVVQVLDTLPDILERDCALSPKAVEVVQKSIDDLRYTLAERTYEACAAELMDNEEEGESGEEE
ncbi:DUF1441 family protein [Citrobacter freundii]|nr:DUF1441 family protein [Citrobacter freundii]